MKSLFTLLILFSITVFSNQAIANDSDQGMSIVDNCFDGPTKPNDPDGDIHIFDPMGDPIENTEPGIYVPR